MEVNTRELAPVVPEPLPKLDPDLSFNDMKNVLLMNLEDDDLIEFQKDITAELTIRRCTTERYNRYLVEVNQYKTLMKENMEIELKKFNKELDSSKALLRKKHLKQVIKEDSEDNDEDNDEEEESEEIAIKPKKRGRKKKVI